MEIIIARNAHVLTFPPGINEVFLKILIRLQPKERFTALLSSPSLLSLSHLLQTTRGNLPLFQLSAAECWESRGHVLHHPAMVWKTGRMREAEWSRRLIPHCQAHKLLLLWSLVSLTNNHTLFISLLSSCPFIQLFFPLYYDGWQIGWRSKKRWLMKEKMWREGRSCSWWTCNH